MHVTELVTVGQSLGERVGRQNIGEDVRWVHEPVMAAKSIGEGRAKAAKHRRVCR